MIRAYEFEYEYSTSILSAVRCRAVQKDWMHLGATNSVKPPPVPYADYVVGAPFQLWCRSARLVELVAGRVRALAIDLCKHACADACGPLPFATRRGSRAALALSQPSAAALLQPRMLQRALGDQLLHLTRMRDVSAIMEPLVGTLEQLALSPQVLARLNFFIYSPILLSNHSCNL